MRAYAAPAKVDLKTTTVGEKKVSSIRLGATNSEVECGGIVFFEHYNYQGQGNLVNPTTSEELRLSSLGFDNRASSAIVMGKGNRFRVFDEVNYLGVCNTISGVVPALDAYVVGNDRVSSTVRLAPNHFYHPCNSTETSLKLFSGANSTAKSLPIESDIPDLAARQFNDLAVSVQWMHGVTGPPVALYSDRNYQGKCTSVGGNIDNLSGTSVGANAASSVWITTDCPGLGITLDPESVSMTAGRVDVFGTATDRTLWRRWLLGGGWGGPEFLGGGLISAPAVSSWGVNRLDVFIKGDNKALWQKTYDGKWQDGKMVTTSNAISSAPAAVSWGPNRIDVAVRADDGKLRHYAWSGSAWTADFFAGPLEGGPSISSQCANKLDVFYRKSGEADKVTKLTAIRRLPLFRYCRR
ncbi:MAG: hypothetical protein NTZ05_15435 [Chloroflexi bacterium]|nr:hypothetical protein [Chloroflexota bacterium]